MNWHEIVNDRIDTIPVVISYCPLCGSGMAFDRRAGGTLLTFGVSGLLYNSDVLMYDRETESLWSQLMMRAVSGPLRGKSLRLLPLEHTTWLDFKSRYPNGKALSRRTGHARDYNRNPYIGYERRAGLYFPVARRDDRLFEKTQVAGIVAGGSAKAYPIPVLRKIKSKEIRDKAGGMDIVINYDPNADSVRAFRLDGSEIPVVRAFWFAWSAFHPNTEIFPGTD